MLGSAILDVAIGLVFVFLLVSLMVTALTELLAGWRKWRARTLWNGLVNLLDDPGSTAWTSAVYTHPLIQGISPPAPAAAAGAGAGDLAGGKHGPSYIEPRTFALALLDAVREKAKGDLDALLARMGEPAAAETQAALADLAKVPGLAGPASDLLAKARASGVTAAELKKSATDLVATLPDPALVQTGIARLRDCRLGRALGVLLADVSGDAEKLKQEVARWFDEGMDLVSGWYKRHTQLVHVFLALGLTLGVDVDSVLIVQRLSTDSALRGAIVAEAQGYARQSPPPSSSLSSLNDQLASLDLPIGWTLAATNVPPDPTHSTLASWADVWPAVRFHFWGWLLTAIAASLGAPFWFDVLNKIITIRAAGKAPG